MDGEDEFEAGPDGPSRCPLDCPNAGAPYCPTHEDPKIYRRDENNLHLVEAYANNAARDMVVAAIEHLRERRRLKEVRVPTRLMDEWVVFTKKVVLDSGEYTAQGEVERRIALWLDKAREQDWDRLDRIKERYMRFTGDFPDKAARSEVAKTKAEATGDARGPKAAPLRRPAKRKAGYGPDAEYFEEEF